ncbi:hypothetical protein M501DRAFT_171539 [Patellaria atrata CBS 101060]|uniref:Uncharacterized protein n=1 Tax=Patellaria atrata CBS 101060 TaxID=1346257 RepID=A0A9P4S9G9_9PEZI|nr:hypothetical protein M501DRAFT_171539 [Patellaria atrata CBS 101060]
MSQPHTQPAYGRLQYSYPPQGPPGGYPPAGPQGGPPGPISSQDPQRFYSPPPADQTGYPPQNQPMPFFMVPAGTNPAQAQGNRMSPRPGSAEGFQGRVPSGLGPSGPSQPQGRPQSTAYPQELATGHFDSPIDQRQGGFQAPPFAQAQPQYAQQGQPHPQRQSSYDDMNQAVYNPQQRYPPQEDQQPFDQGAYPPQQQQPARMPPGVPSSPPLGGGYGPPGGVGSAPVPSGPGVGYQAYRPGQGGPFRGVEAGAPATGAGGVQGDEGFYR